MEKASFTGGGLCRAAELRDDPAALARLQEGGRCAVLWRGKALLDGQDRLAWLDPAAPLVRDRPLLFLGVEEGQGLFACDLSDWDPEDGAAAVAGGFMDSSRQGHPLADPAQGFEDLRNVMTRLSAFEAEVAVTAKAVLHWQRSHRFCAACGAESMAGKALWQRDCPACGAQHFPRTDPVVIMIVEDGDRLLLGRSPGWPEGMYSLLAGFMEPGETIEAAVRREVREETSVRVGAVRILATQPWPWPASLMIGCRARALSRDIAIDPRELEDALWVTRKDLVAVLAGTHPRLRAGRQGAIARQLMRDWLADCLT